MLDEYVRIADNRKINGKYYKLIFRSRGLSRRVLPGQFMNMQINQGLDPFLRRPFSYYRVRGAEVEILYEVFGLGTQLLADKKKGEVLRVAGPLGKPFSLSAKPKKRILVGGGVGVPPLVFLAEICRVEHLLIGTKSKDEVLPKRELAKVRGGILHSTDDGSYGARGLVTALLERILRKERPENVFIQTCGPTAMMRAVYDIARKLGIRGEASLEKPMACGVGACLGCMVKTPKGWVPSCVEGPVFNFDQITEW